MKIDVWFDFASTYSYPAVMRIGELATNQGIDINWRAFLLGPIFNQQGWTDSPFNLYPAKGAYMWRDLERLCSDLQLPYQKPTAFPRNGLLAARITCFFADEPWIADFVQAVFRANFARDEDIALPDVISTCLLEAGQDAENILAAANSPEAKQALREQTERASQMGLFGAPFFVVGNEQFWGNDRLERALEWAQGQRIS